jgi:aflatoxin B1 aldehyde reductase
LSNYTSYEVAEIALTCAHNGWLRPTIYQAHYNCISRSIEDELIPSCRRYGLDVVIYSPIAGGFLSGAIKSKDDNPTEGRFAPSPFMQFTRGRYFKDGVIGAAQLIAEESEKFGLNPLEVAMRWVTHHSKLNVHGGDGVIIGFSNLGQLKDNLDYLEKPPLPDELVEVLEQAWQLAKPEAANYWLGEQKYTYDTQQVLFGNGK